MSGHWTDDELIGHIYGVGPEDGHMEHCSECQGRVEGMRANRLALEEPAEVSFELLAAQRRKVYGRISQPAGWNVKRWAPVAATALVLASGLFVYEQDHHHSAQVQISDAQLALDASRMAADAEPDAVAPLQALFQE